MPRQDTSNNPRKRQPRSSVSKAAKAVEAHTSFAQTYPTIAQWVESRGWIEIGQDDFSSSMVRALDIGGMIWEGKTKYSSLDELLHHLENGLSAWLEEHG
jgi:hypothetical protein